MLLLLGVTLFGQAIWSSCHDGLVSDTAIGLLRVGLGRTRFKSALHCWEILLSMMDKSKVEQYENSTAWWLPCTKSTFCALSEFKALAMNTSVTFLAIAFCGHQI